MSELRALNSMSRYAAGLIAVIVIGSGATAHAHSPAQFLEVIEGKANSEIQHGVEVQTQLDSKRGNVDLVGPKRFARAVMAMGRSGKPADAYLTWYQIEKPQDTGKKTVSILDPFRGGNQTQLNVSAAEYLLCPTQVISTGSPSPIPEGLDFYKAYKTVDAKPLKAKVTVGSGETKQERVIGKPVYVCIAAKHWHHDAFNDATHPQQCYVVYELDEQKLDEKISTLDQFGINQFQAKSTKWICVTGKLLESE